jgi:hypothetical protein
MERGKDVFQYSRFCFILVEAQTRKYGPSGPNRPFEILNFKLQLCPG